VSKANPLEVAAWRMAAGSLASEDLPEIATEALTRASIVLLFVFSPDNHGTMSETRPTCSALLSTNLGSMFLTSTAPSGA